MKDIVRKVADAVTIVFPALISVAAGLQMVGVADVLERAHGVVVVVLGAVASIASIVFNAVSDIRTKGECDE